MYQIWREGLLRPVKDTGSNDRQRYFIVESRSTDLDTRSQMLRGTIELGLPSRRTRHNILEQSRKNKKLGQERSDPNVACLEELHLKNMRIWTLRQRSISKASEIYEQYQSSVKWPRGSTEKTVDLRIFSRYHSGRANNRRSSRGT